MGFGESHKVTLRTYSRPETLLRLEAHPCNLNVEYRWPLWRKAGILGGD
jgi:hypothetical protein